MADLVIPGVAVRVVKEVIAPQLAPSGILGLVGLVGATRAYEGAAAMAPAAAKSWARFSELFGPASARSLPEAVQALQNGVSQLVVVPVAGADAAKCELALDGLGADVATAQTIALKARAPGPWANKAAVAATVRTVAGAKSVELAVSLGEETLEAVRGLPPGKTAEETAALLNARLALFEATAGATQPAADAAPKAGRGAAADSPAPDADAASADAPRSFSAAFADGKDAPDTAYIAALQKLSSEPDVDMVIAAVADWSDAKKVAKVHAAVAAHCARMAAVSAGRIGFAEVPPPGAAGYPSIADQANQILSDRMVLVAPHGVLGAVAGMVGSLDYFQSPTFKTVLGVTDLPRLAVEEQEALLNAGAVPVAAMRGRGTVVVRGLTTDRDQISVRRVADRAVRGVKMIGELFIGRLNTATQRGALQEKLTEFLVQMERDGALVPSTDGRDPAFKVNVYSSQADFQQGIVRVDMAVRPVRAIDYIYATVLVQG